MRRIGIPTQNHNGNGVVEARPNVKKYGGFQISTVLALRHLRNTLWMESPIQVLVGTVVQLHSLLSWDYMNFPEIPEGIARSKVDLQFLSQCPSVAGLYKLNSALSRYHFEWCFSDAQ